MTVREIAPTEQHIRYIVNHLRERDLIEIFALRWDNDPEGLVRDIVAVAGAMWRVWTVNDEPVSVAGMTPIRPGVIAAGAFGTALFPRVVRPMLRWGRDWVFPRLRVAGFHRGECYALASNTDGRKFIEACGGEIEALLHGYGRNREDFLLYAWRLDDVLQRSKAPGQSGRHKVHDTDRDQNSRPGRAAIRH
jgi:hypothetical protein